MEKQKFQRIRDNLFCQYSIFFLFLIAVHFLPSTKLITIISLFALLISSFILFFYKGKIRTTHFLMERYVLFLLQLFIFRKLGAFQGYYVNELFGWSVNQLLRYWLPLYQLACLLGYNFGIKQLNKSRNKRNYLFAK